MKNTDTDRILLLVVNILVFNTSNHLSQQVASADRLICRKFLKILPEPENIRYKIHVWREARH